MRLCFLTMYSGNESTSGFPTPWNLNPVAYQNMDTSQVDWAALAQQWIQMKETYPADRMPPAPPPPPIRLPVRSSGLEGGEAPMEVESFMPEAPPAPNITPSQWDNSWNNDVGWNQWNVASAPSWGWDGSKSVGTAISSAPTPYGSFQSGDGSYSGYTAASSASYNPGYWTAGTEAASAPDVAAGTLRPEGVPPPPIKPIHKNQVKQPIRMSAPIKQYHHPATVEATVPIVQPPDEILDMPALDAAKRRQLPAWIREGLEKMEREKQKQLERERLLKEKEEKKQANKLDDSDPSKSKFDTDGEESNGEMSEVEDDLTTAAKSNNVAQQSVSSKTSVLQSPPRLQRSHEEILQEVMLNVRRTLTEILLEVTNEEILSVSQEEMARYKASKQASRGGTVAKLQALPSLGGRLGLGIYGESSGSESGSESEEEQNTFRDKYITDAQLLENIRRRKSDFEKTAREIEAQIAEADNAVTQVQQGRGEEARSPRGDTPSPPPPSYTNVDKESSSGKKEEDMTPPRNVPKQPSLHRSLSETDGNKWDNENSSQSETLKYNKMVTSSKDKSSELPDKYRRDDRISKNERSSKENVSYRDYKFSQSERIHKDEKSSSSDKTINRKISIDDKLKTEEKIITKFSKEDQLVQKYKDSYLVKERTPSREDKFTKNKLQMEKISSNRSEGESDINLKNIKQNQKTNVERSGQRKNNDSKLPIKDSKKKYSEAKKEEYSPKSNRDFKSNSSSSDESSHTGSSSRTSDESKSEDSSQTSSNNYTSGDESSNKNAKYGSRESSGGSPKRKVPKKNNEIVEHADYKNIKKIIDPEIDQNNFDVESELSSKYKYPDYKYPDRQNEKGENRYEYSPKREYQSTKRRHSEKSRSRSYERSSYRSRSRDRNMRDRDYEKYSEKSPRRGKDYYKRERDRSVETYEKKRLYEKSRDRSRERSRSYNSKGHSRGRSSERYRERSREHRERRDSRSRSRSKYYRSHRY